jgi:hypothetical protein
MHNQSTTRDLNIIHHTEIIRVTKKDSEEEAMEEEALKEVEE